MINLTDEEIKELFEKFKYKKEILNFFGLTSNGTGQRFIKRIAEQINFDLSKFGKNGKIKSKEYSLNPKKCKNCGKVIDFEHKKNNFCSKECAFFLNSKKENRKCVFCGNTLKKSSLKYCSCKCQKEFLYEQFITEWKNGEQNGVKGKDCVKTFIRTYLFRKYDSKCQKCGWGQINLLTNKTPLEIHHIDGNCLNNKEDNLELLCPNCHSLTNTFGILNKNKSKRNNKK